MDDEQEHWDGSERRHSHPHVRHGAEPSNSDLVELILSVRSELRAHITEERPFFKDAFPDGDPIKHRLEHEASQAASKAQEEFYRSLRLKLAETGLLGTLRLLGWLLAISLGAWVTTKFGIIWANGSQ